MVSVSEEQSRSGELHDGDVLMVVNDRPLFDSERKRLFEDDESTSSAKDGTVDNPSTLQTQPETPPSNNSSQSSPYPTSSHTIEAFNPFVCGVPAPDPIYQAWSNDDSERMLEATARRIRTELWEEEMLELAEEAERAAASGQTKFTAQPSTFQDGSDETIARPELMRRSFSEGGLGARRRRSSSILAPYDNKLPVMDLRDVNEVFPSFKQFHIHLRTHFHRSKVDERQLLFRESSRKHRSPPRHHPGDFIRSFRLDRWVPKTGPKTYFDRLSSHIATSPPRAPPKIDAPPGLPALVQNQKEQYYSYKTLSTEDSTATLLTDMNDSICKAPSKDSSTSRPATPASDMAPRALFDSEFDDASVELDAPSMTKPKRVSTFDDEEAEPSQNSLLEDVTTPKVDNHTASSDFVTPARLRTIRGIRRNDFNHPGLALPTNSLSEESPMRTILPRRRRKRRSEPNIAMPVLETVLDVSDSLTFNDSKDNSAIVLPGFDPNVKDDEERDASPLSITTDMKQSMLTPAASREDDETISVDSLGLLKNQLSEPRILSGLGSLESQGSNADAEVFFESRVDSPIVVPDNSLVAEKTPSSNNGQSPRKVKLSVYRGSGQKDAACMQSLQHSQIIRIEESLTPLRESDCGCLALSPVGSFEDNDGEPNNAEDSPKSTSTGALNRPNKQKDKLKKRDPNGLECAMEMISRFGADQKPLYVRSNENDDFMNNFLYCSKQPEKEEPLEGCEPCGTDTNVACGATNTEFCCNSIVQDVVTLGVFFPPRRSYAGRNLVKLSSSGVPAAQETWFDLAQSKAIFGRWVGRQEDECSRLNVNFQAPSLRKIRSDPSHREPSPSENLQGYDDMFDIPTRPYNKQHRRHTRQLSYVDEQSTETLSTTEISS